MTAPADPAPPVSQPSDLRALVDELDADVVGRRREIELVVAAVAVDRHIVIEGPPGTGKSTLLRAVARQLGIGFEFVEGNAELTPARLVGHFDPARVLTEGYDPDVFVPGALVTALRDGALLYVEELNRIPEETLNVLITVMSERELHVPRLGRIEAAPGFRLVAAMNPFDAVGTARISGAVYDRVCRIAVDYQSVDDEVAITRRVTSASDSPTTGTTGISVDSGVAVERIVRLVRSTRDHPDIRVGSSVRGAIDMAEVTTSLAALRNGGVASRDVSLDAALVALSGRIRVREGCARTAEDIVTELWRSVFASPDDADDTGTDEGKATAPGGATTT